MLKRAAALLILAIPALAALGVVGPSSPARAATDGKGYWEVASDGGIFSFGDAKFQGSTGGAQLNAPIVGMAAHPSGDGYWFVASDGGVFGFGAAKFFGSMGGQKLNAPIVGMAAHPSGDGYWLVADDGGIFSFGASKFFGSMGGSALNEPIVGMAAHPSGTGYWFVASDGGIFSFGASKFFGSMGGQRLNLPIVGMAGHPSGNGYWFVASDGGVFSFGDSKFFGSMGGSKLNRPVVGMAATPDSTKPTATVNQASNQEDPTDENSVEFTVTFSEPASGFTGSDVTIGGTAGGSKTATVTGGPNTYTVSVTGMTTDGTVTVSVPANAAVDSSGNGNAVATSTDNTVTYDDGRPAATVATADGETNPTNDDTIDFKVVFNEPVTDFDDLGDVAVGGTAAGTKTWVITKTGDTYNVAVSGVTGNSGTVTLQVLEGKAVDTAGNTNAASNVHTITVDRAGPGVSATKASTQNTPTNDDTIDFTVTFTEVVTGFTDDDVALSGDSGANDVIVTNSGDGKNFNVAVSGMTDDGTVTITVGPNAATDAAGNNSTGTATASVTYDESDPTPTLAKASTQENPTDESAIDFTVLFDEPVTDFDDAGDVVVTGAPGGTATIGDAGDADAKTYTVTVTGMTGNGGPVTVGIPQGAAKDLAGNPSNASSPTTVTVTYDNLDPTFDSITSNGESTTVVATFSEPVLCSTVKAEAFGASVGGTSEEVVAATCTGDTDNTIELTLGRAPDGGESVQISYAKAAGAITDKAGNEAPSATRSTTAVSSFTVEVSPATGQDDPTNDDAVDFTVTFSEAVANDSFKAQDVAVGGTADYTGGPVVTITNSGDSTTYNVAVSGFTPNTTGNVIVTIPAGRVQDDDDDVNAASTPKGDTDIAYDNQSPTVTTVEKASTQENPTDEDIVDFTVVFSEVVEGFSTDDLEIGKTGTVATEPAVDVEISSTDGKTYSVAIGAVTGDGTLTLRVKAGGAMDAADNLNQASAVTPASVTIDNTGPGATIDEADGQNDTTNESEIDFEVTFTEPVFGLTANDFAVTEGPAGGTATGLTPTASPLVYIVTVTGMTNDGNVELTLPADRAVDQAGNTNTASTVALAGDNVVTRETVRPVPTVTHADSDGVTNAKPIVFTVDFGEPVNNFTVDDVTVTANGEETYTVTASPTGTRRTYNINVSGAALTDGPVTVQVKEGGTTDDAGNTNVASNEDTVTFDTVGPSVTVSQHASQTEDPTDEAQIEFLVVFSEPVSDFNAGDVTVTGADPTATVVTAEGTDKTTYKVTVSGMTGDEVDVSVSVAAGRAHDVAGNPNKASNAETIRYDKIAPTFTGIAANAGSPKVFATFDELLRCTTVGTNDFTATVGGSARVVIAVSCTGPHDDVIELTLDSPPDAGQTVEVTLRTSGGGVSDRAGNVTSTPATRTTTAVPLTTTVTRVGDEYTNASSVQFTVEFSEDVTGFDASDVTVTPAGTYTVSVTPTTGPENVYTVTLANLPAGETTFSVSVGAGKAHDADGTPNAASNVATVKHDTVAPMFDSIVATAGSPDVVVKFTTPVRCSTVQGGDFAVEFTGDVSATVTGRDCSGVEDAEFKITLDKPAPPGTTVEVTLSGEIKDLAGNVVASATKSDQALT